MKKSLFFLIALMFAANLNAQSISIGAQGSYVKSADAVEGVIMPSAAVRINLVGLKVEGSIGYKQDKYFDGAVKTTTYPIMLTGFLNLLPIIHVEGGIGWYNTKVEYSGIYAAAASETYSDIGYHAGAGLEIPLGNLLLTGDIRYVIEKTKLANAKNTNELKSDFYMVVVGLMFKIM